MMDKYPVPALAFFDENFLPLTTASSQLLRVNEYNHLYVTRDYGTPAGVGTNPSTGHLPYDSTTYTTLDSISINPTDTLMLYGVHVAGTTQAKAEIVLVSTDPDQIILLGLITESYPNWDPYIGVPLKITTSLPATILLRIKGLRQGRSGDGTGRLFARIV